MPKRNARQKTLKKTVKRYSDAASSPILTEICRRLNAGTELEDGHLITALNQPKMLRKAMVYYGCPYVLITDRGEVRFRPASIASGVPRTLTNALRDHQTEEMGSATTPKRKRIVKKAANDDAVPFWKSAKSFYNTEEWKRLRYEVLTESNGRCGSCGASARDGATLRVDHIKPISRYPHLKADKSNLQVLCNDCNWGKGAWDETDWRSGPLFPMTANGRTSGE